MGDAHHCSGPPVSEMTYTVLSETLNPSIPYHTSGHNGYNIQFKISADKLLFIISLFLLLLLLYVKRAVAFYTRIETIIRCTGCQAALQDLAFIIARTRLADNLVSSNVKQPCGFDQRCVA